MSTMNDPNADVKAPDNEHWLVRPATIRWLWWGGSAVLLLTVLAQWIWPIKGYFGVDGWPAFGAVFGFLCCVAMVLVAKGLGLILKRPEAYYDPTDSLQSGDADDA